MRPDEYWAQFNGRGTVLDEDFDDLQAPIISFEDLERGMVGIDCAVQTNTSGHADSFFFNNWLKNFHNPNKANKKARHAA
jgi:hypothetical protein